jgi:alkylation response protein AidB-like acyl-CoA dehydrogenase
MAKNSIRGTATGQLAFENMFVPKENVLGQVGKGLRIALTVLDFGRTTFGASCTGVAKACVAAASRHVKKRVQFEQPLADFELVKQKIAWMAAHAFAMEAATAQCAGFIDRGSEDFMVETAMLKVSSTRCLVANRQRHHASHGREELLSRSALRTLDARRPVKPRRRRSQRCPTSLYLDGWH